MALVNNAGWSEGLEKFEFDHVLSSAVSEGYLLFFYLINCKKRLVILLQILYFPSQMQTSMLLWTSVKVFQTCVR